MAPIHVQSFGVIAFHEPSEAPPGFGVRQSSGALAVVASRPKAPEGWRTPRRYRAIRRFMVQMRGGKTVKASHEGGRDHLIAYSEVLFVLVVQSLPNCYPPIRAQKGNS